MRSHALHAPAPPPADEAAELRRLLAKERRISAALMDRVERSADLQGGAFQLFETAIALESKVRDRTGDLERALAELADANAALARSQREAEEARRRLADAIESSNEGFAIFDGEDRLVLCNTTYLGLWPRVAARIRPGVTFGEIATMVAEEGIVLGARVAPDHWMSERLAQHAVANGGHVHALADGRWIQINELRTSEGGIVGVYTDITEVKAEDARARVRALEEMNEALERRVAERTAELEQARAAAEQANVSKTRFLAAASHDLLQPLNAARLFVSALAERRLAAPSLALARQASAALDSVEDLLEALLEISRLDAGAIVPEVREFPVQELLAAMRAQFMPFARKRGLTLSVDDCGDWVRSDPRLLRRIIQNFIANALRYTGEGGVRVHCSELGAGLISISVTDSGPGIAPEHHAAIFEEFRRIDAPGRERGMGLGLAIVRRAARMLEHDIGLISAPGEGSTFSVTLPTARPAIPEEVKPRPRAGKPVSRVLVIDNEPAILEAMRAILEGWGCAVDTASTLREALAAAHIRAPQLVLADYHLDGETGDAVVGQLREALGAGLPAIIVTADRTAELRDALQAAGFGLLTKPVKPAQLRALISKVVTEP